MSHPDQAQYPRLQGDDLYTWAQLINEAEHAQGNLRKFGRQIAQKYNLPEDRLVITGQGYLILEEVGPTPGMPPAPSPNGRPPVSEVDDTASIAGVHEP